MNPPMVKNHQRAMAHLRVSWQRMADDPHVTAYYRACRRRQLDEAMNMRHLEKEWVRAMYPRLFAKEYPNG